MAFFAEKNDEWRDYWHEDDWTRFSADEQEHEDAIFGTLDEDEPDNAHELMTNEIFSMHPIEMSLSFVERLSWDAASQCSSDEEMQTSDLMLPPLLPLQVDAALEGNNLHTGLVSPTSGTSSPTLSPLTRVSISSPIHQLNFFEPELEYEASDDRRPSGTQQLIEKGDGKELDCVDQNPCFSSHSNNLSTTPTCQRIECVTIPTEVISDSERDGDNQVGSESAHRLQVPSIAHWRRTCSRAGSIGMPRALSFMARTRSISRLQSQSFDDEDDGDFSSDDEGYSPELHHYHKSKTGSLNDSPRRRASLSSMTFSRQRLSVNMNPALTKRLEEAKDKVNYGLTFFRSRSRVSTVTSEESYMDSPVCQELKSAPAGTYREPSIFSKEATSTSLLSAASVVTDKQFLTRQYQLRQGVFKAAGLLSAASADAAHKLTSRGYCAPLGRSKQKETSETEEEDLESSSCPDHCGSLAI